MVAIEFWLLIWKFPTLIWRRTNSLLLPSQADCSSSAMPVQGFPNRIGMTRLFTHGDPTTIDRFMTSSLDEPFMSRCPPWVSYLPRDHSLVFLPLRFRLNLVRIHQKLVPPISPLGGTPSRSGQHSLEAILTFIATIPYPLNLLFEKMSLIQEQRTIMAFHFQAIIRRHTPILSNQIHSPIHPIQIKSVRPPSPISQDQLHP